MRKKTWNKTDDETNPTKQNQRKQINKKTKTVFDLLDNAAVLEHATECLCDGGRGAVHKTLGNNFGQSVKVGKESTEELDSGRDSRDGGSFSRRQPHADVGRKDRHKSTHIQLVLRLLKNEQDGMK
jgi:hypothetical protein